MNIFIQKLKKHLPKPIKNLLKPIYHVAIKGYKKYRSLFYKNRLADELSRFDVEAEINDLPEIFHYWSNKYLVPKLSEFGFNNPDEFFLKYAKQAIKNNPGYISILSIGAGNCDTEVALAKNLTALGYQKFIIDCMDINQQMFERGKELAASQGVADKLAFLPADFNRWEASKQYALIIANQSLHHVVELEHLYENIELALTDQGKFITSDVIGRNGHQRWPEALDLLKPIWKNMPARYKHNHAMQRFEKKYINHDCSTEGFEGIRAQDVLPLLIEKFDFELFIPFANLIMIFIDRPFGPNFDHANPEDLAFIDRIHQLDEMHMINGDIKPTQMLAAMNKKSVVENQTIYSQMSPKEAIRLPTN